MGKKNEAAGVQREVMEAIARRMASRFDRPHWGGAPNYHTDDASSVLGVIQPEEVQMLITVGLLAADEGSETVSAQELLRFLEAHGSWWFQVRLEKQMEQLREEIGRAERLAEQAAT